jgi:hypothetical protein
MPWTAKQLKLFRAAAHNPAIAKSSGIKQADAERMSKEGLKKAKGGAVPTMINRQDTRHGKMDMPYQKLNRFAGMKEGGVMKKRRFDEGGDVDYEVDENAEPERKYFASGVSAKDREYTPPKAAVKKSEPVKKETKFEDVGPKEDTSPARNIKSIRRSPLPSKEQQAKNAERMAKIGEAAAMAIPVGRVAKGAHEAQKAANFRRLAASNPTKAPSAAEWERRINAGELGFRKGGIMRSKREIGKDQMSMAPYKKGGEMESKAMMKKEIGFMQKKGAPASMIKHEKAEMKGYKKGGSIKETMGPRNMSQDVEKGSNTRLKHGEHGIQKRGHTRGMEERMQGGPKKFAAGGSVRAHGEHSIQLKGHTRGKVY